MHRRNHGARNTGDRSNARLAIVQGIFFVLVLTFVGRLFYLQIVKGGDFSALASQLRDVRRVIAAQRGIIWVHERAEDMEGELFPIARNVSRNLVYAVPKEITDPAAVASDLSPLLGLPREELEAKLAKKNDPYEPLLHRVGEETRLALSLKALPGIGVLPEYVREYPEGPAFGVVTGFVQGEGAESRGQYGLEQGQEELLRGISGLMVAERDTRGNVIPVGLRAWEDPLNGSDLVLTIDHAIQYRACGRLEEAVNRHHAKGGALIVLDPVTGALRAVCSSPRYDPNQYAEVKDLSVYMNKTVSGAWEPGSIFKAITMAGALEFNALTPDTVYTDKGLLAIDRETIRNADNKVYGTQTMTDVLAQSINTGAVFAQQAMGVGSFREIVARFGFGAAYDVGLPAEHAGDVSSLDRAGDIYAATASFGQGITVTPLQMAAAFGAIANGGVLMRPYIIEEVRHPDGRIERHAPEEIRRVISPKTAVLLRAMLVTVVEEGHGKRAGVRGFWVAGKTGTAQLAVPGTRGYDPHKTIGSFVGFGPVSSPRFVILTRIDEPKSVQYAESTAAPLFGEIADFLFQYYRILPERNIR